MASDPYERNDLLAQRPDIADDLIAAWQGYADEVGVVVGD